MLQFGHLEWLWWGSEAGLALKGVLLIYYYQGVGGLGLGKILAKLNLPNIICLFRKLDCCHGKIDCSNYFAPVFAQLNLNFTTHLTSDT